MGEGKYTREDCLALLTRKRAELAAAGEERLPQRSDFADAEVVAVKAFLGPWPRALEAAGLKAPRAEDRLEKNRAKRARGEKRRKRERRTAKSAAAEANDTAEGTDAENG